MRIISSPIRHILLFTLLIGMLFLSSCDGFKRPYPNYVKLEPIAPIVTTDLIPVVENQKIIHKKLKVATLLPLTGKNKDLGGSMLNSIVLSLFENDKNNDIELVILDSSNIKKAATQIINQDITVVIGPIFSSSTQELKKELQGKKISVLSFSNNRDLINNDNVFLMGFLPEQQIDKISSYSISAGKDNFSIIAPNNRYGQIYATILQEMVRKKDGNFITSEFYSNTKKDLERAVAKVVKSYNSTSDKSQKNLTKEDKFYTNVILIPASGKTLSKITTLINKFNVDGRDIQILGNNSWDENSTLNDPNLIGGWFTSSDPAKYLDFEKRYYKSYQKFPTRMNSIGYDASLAVIKTLETLEERKLMPEDLINYQSANNGFDGIDGLFRFLPNGIVQRNFAILEVQNRKFEMIDSPSTMFFKY
ncbi:MAG: ABC-type branched-subunit amino acid transport system substrate-binding protein [Rickettsiales bacterium]|jgi:ABC-type branched-subunit amino acid transport system substrate-binding protein